MLNSICNRERFIDLIKQEDYKIGLEVGVRTGDYSRFLVKSHKWDEFYGIDCDSKCTSHTQDLTEYNYKMVIGKSPDIAVEFKDNYFDFIYIDAWHTYESVTKDLIAWYPKLKEGKLFCGDDYMLAHDHPESKFEIVEAVEDFCKERNITYYVTGFSGKAYNEKRKFASDTWNDFKHRGIQKTTDIPQWYLIKCSQ